MAMFGSNAFAQESYIPAPAAETFAALQTFLKQSGWTTASVDAFTMSVTFKTGITAMTYGMNAAVQIVPNGEGSSLNVSVTPKMGGQYRNGANQQRIADEVLAGVSRAIQQGRLPADKYSNPDDWS
jgi:hypothetical protein